MTEPDDHEQSWYPETLAIGVALIALFTFVILLLSMSSIGDGEDRQTVDDKHETVLSNTEPAYTWSFRDEVVVTVGFRENGDPLTVHVRPVLAFDGDDKMVRPELERRRHQLKSVVLKTLANEPTNRFREPEFQELGDRLVNEINKSLTGAGRIQSVYFESFYIE